MKDDSNFQNKKPIYQLKPTLWMKYEREYNKVIKLNGW